MVEQIAEKIVEMKEDAADAMKRFLADPSDYGARDVASTMQALLDIQAALTKLVETF